MRLLLQCSWGYSKQEQNGRATIKICSTGFANSGWMHMPHSAGHSLANDVSLPREPEGLVDEGFKELAKMASGIKLFC